MISGAPPNPRLDRQRVLVWFLQGAGIVVLVLAVAALLLPRDRRPPAAWLMVAALISIPVIRVAWLAIRWVGRRDWRFAGAAAALLGVLAISLALSLR